MRALMVVESMFGNTREIAEAVAQGLGARFEVEVVAVGAAPAAIDADVDLLVVGGPTHAHGMSTPDSRQSAAERDKEGQVAFQVGIREWLAALRPAGGATASAAFDTRIKGPGLLWGSAAKAAAKELRRLGFREAARPESFLVKGPLGPVHHVLVEGEVERARAWAAALAGRVAAGSASGS
jgi:hypothetical protein